MPVFARATFLSGSRFDHPGKEGTSHFLEHMIVAGTKRFPSKDKLAAYIEQFGGGFSAFTGADSVSVNVAVGDPADLEKAFEVMHEILTESTFESSTVETERGSILRELGDKKSNPSEMVWEVYRKLFFREPRWADLLWVRKKPLRP